MAFGVPVVSVVIPARDEEGMIGACICALRQQSIDPNSIEVIVVAAGSDQTAAVAAREGTGKFGRFEVVRLEAGNKNKALQSGCRRAHAEAVVLLDADTEAEPGAIAELLRVQALQPCSVVHGAALPRIDTWVSRYWELNRKLVKDLDFDGNLSGELVMLPRAALLPVDLDQLFPASVSAQDDLHLGRMLRQRGWRIGYAPQARATTLVPWTLRGVLVTMLRSRRGLMRLLPFPDAAMQAAKSALLVAAVPLALIAGHRSIAAGAACLLPLLVHLAVLTWRVETVRRRGLGNFRRTLPAFVMLDLLARGIKLWAFIERLAGRNQPVPFRGERPLGNVTVMAAAGAVGRHQSPPAAEKISRTVGES